MPPYAKELSIAIHAVHHATILTKTVFHNSSKGSKSKSDASPVTIGDFGAQALIISAIRQSFPDDEIIAEEEASLLRQDDELRSEIWNLVKATRLEDETDKRIGGAVESADSMLDLIDSGKSKGGATGRFWALDPIDGTKGFLRGGQYAVCLALIVDGQVQVGVLGCPNLPVDDTVALTSQMGAEQSDGDGKGVLFAAVAGQGATSRCMTDGSLGEPQPIQMRSVSDITQAIFCESVEAGHSSHSDQAAIAAKLGIRHASVRMDSQAKYGSIARGAGDIYLRLPVKATYEEKIWDHAAGDLIVREAGGRVTDVNGARLDFTRGRTLARNKGVVAAATAIHEQVLAVVKEVLHLK